VPLRVLDEERVVAPPALGHDLHRPDLPDGVRQVARRLHLVTEHDLDAAVVGVVRRAAEAVALGADDEPGERGAADLEARAPEHVAARERVERARPVLGTRERILDAVLAAFVEGDPDVLNVAAVARRAGVSRQAVYLHFPNRTALGVAAVQWLDERESLTAAVAPIFAAGTPEDTLDAYAEFLGGFNPRIAGVARMAYRLRALPEIEAAWQDRLRSRRGGAGLIAQRIADAGRLRPPFTARTAGDWLAAAASVLVWDELTQDLGWSRQRYVQHLRATFHATLLAPP
jgi:AcrR family transcriptional regulator